MALPKNINLNTDKRNPLVYEGLTLRQSEQNLIMQATLLNPDKSPYDLSGGKTVTFNEHKQNDKFVVDTAVKIVDASHGNISYVLNKQCFAASGEGWFEIISKDGQVVDSTQIFRMNVLDAANANIANTNYISKLDNLRDQMQSLVDSADGTLKSELQNAQNQLNSNVDSIKKTYNDLTIGFQNQFKQAQDSRAQSGSDALNKFNSDSSKVISDFKTNSQNAINAFNSNGNKAIADFKTNSDSKVNSNISNWNAQWQQAYSDFNNKLAQDQKSYEDTLKKLENQVNSDNATAQQISATLADLNKKVSDTSDQIAKLKANFNSTVFAKASDVYTKTESDANLKNLWEQIQQALVSYEQQAHQTKQSLETALAQALDEKQDKGDYATKVDVNNKANKVIPVRISPYKLVNDPSYQTGLYNLLSTDNSVSASEYPKSIKSHYLAYLDKTLEDHYSIYAINQDDASFPVYGGLFDITKKQLTWTKISSSTTYTNQDIDNKINAHQPDLSGINNNISNLQGQYNALKTKVDGISNKEYIHVVTNETDAANYAKAHPDVVVILKGS